MDVCVIREHCQVQPGTPVVFGNVLLEIFCEDYVGAFEGTVGMGVESRGLELDITELSGNKR